VRLLMNTNSSGFGLRGYDCARITYFRLQDQENPTHAHRIDHPLLLGGGSNSPFADPNRLKYIKKTVIDQERKEQILDLAKEYKTYVKDFA